MTFPYALPGSVSPREPVNVARLVKDWLKNQLAPRFPELQVRLELPSDWAVGSAPVLVVADDGGPLDRWPVATSPTIRATSWTSGRDPRYVSAALAAVLSERIPGIAAVLPGTLMLDAGRDPKNRGDLASFTVRTRARTQ